MTTRNDFIINSSSCVDKYSESCSKEVHKYIRLNWNETNGCVRGSFDDPSNMVTSDNKYLLQDAKIWKKHDLHYIPALVINEQVYQGQLDPVNVFKTI